MSSADLVNGLREEIMTGSLLDSSDRYDKAADILNNLLESDLNNRELSVVVSTIIGLYHDDIVYDTKIFAQLNDVNLRPLRMYKYIIENIPYRTLGYLASGPNVCSRKLFNIICAEPRCWISLLVNPYLSMSQRKRLVLKVTRYINEEPISEYKAVLFRLINGGVLGKNLEVMGIPYLEQINV